MSAHDVDLQLDVLIERRYRQRLKEGEPERPAEPAYAATEREIAADVRAQHREAWAMHHRKMYGLHLDLAAEHAHEARRLGKPLPEVEVASFARDRGEGRA